MNERTSKRPDFSLLPLVRQWMVFGAIILVVAVLAVMFRSRSDSPSASKKSPAVSSQKIKSPPTIPTEGGDVAVVRAVMLARKEVVAEPKSAPKWGALGEILLAHEFDAEAADCFEAAATLNPKDVRWPYLMGLALRKYDAAAARKWLERAVELCGNKPASPRLTLVELLIEQSELDAAGQQLQLYLREDRSNPRARLAQARLTHLRGESKECMDQLQALGAYMQQHSEYKDRTKPILLLMSECARRTGQREQAETFRKMAEQQGQPSWPDEIFQEVNLRRTGLKQFLTESDRLFQRGDYDGAEELLKRTVNDYPDSIWPKILLARVYIRTGAPDSTYANREERVAAAERLLRDTLKQDPRSVEAMFRLGVALGYQGRAEEAMEMYKSAIQAKPDFTMAYFNLAWCRYQNQDRDGAIEDLKTAVKVQPDFTEGLTALGQWLLERGAFEEAEGYLADAARLQPQDARIRSLLGKSRQGQR